MLIFLLQLLSSQVQYFCIKQCYVQYMVTENAVRKSIYVYNVCLFFFLREDLVMQPRVTWSSYLTQAGLSSPIPPQPPQWWTCRQVLSTMLSYCFLMYYSTHTQEGNQLCTELYGVLIIIYLQIILSCVVFCCGG